MSSSKGRFERKDKRFIATRAYGEGLVRRLGRAPAHAGLPEFVAPTHQMQAELAKGAEENGISIGGPPLA